MDLSRDGDSLEGIIELPKDLKGVLLWKNKEFSLKGGKQDLSL